MRNLSLLIVLLFCFTTLNILAQSQKPKTQLVSFGKNVDSPLTIKEKDMLTEVYQGQLEKYILSNPSRLKNMKHLLRNRIQVIQMDGSTNSDKYINLSNVELLDHYNENLLRDKVFNKNNFNPLKYNLPFFKIGGSMYKIYDTNYYLVIKTQTTKK